MRLDPNTIDNQTVFDVYLGLTASGYHLANPERADAIRRAILGGNWNQQVVRYFELARINDGRVNPYWPRASILTTVSLLTEHAEKATHSALVRAYLATMSNISPEEADDATAVWAAALPEHIMSLRSSAGYREVYVRYRDAIRGELRENGLGYERGVLAAHRRLGFLIRPPHNGIEVVTVLNPLQADPLTDVVKSGDRLNVITSHLRVESYVHELVHVFLNPYLRDWTARISQHSHLLNPVYERMAFLRYAWDRSTASWCNVFSETLVRVFTVVVSESDTGASLVSRIQGIVEEGFLYARPIFGTLAENEFQEPLSDQWLDRCLQACLAAAQPHAE